MFLSNFAKLEDEIYQDLLKAKGFFQARWPDRMNRQGVDYCLMHSTGWGNGDDKERFLIALDKLHKAGLIKFRFYRCWNDKFGRPDGALGVKVWALDPQELVKARVDSHS